MNLGEMRAAVARKLSFRSTSPDQDFKGATTTWSTIDDAINEALKDEHEEALTEAGYQRLQMSYSASWPANQLLFQIPGPIELSDLIAVFDVTDDTRGSPLWMGDRLSEGSIAWRDFRTMEWGDSGPNSTRTLLITYVANPAELKEETQSPMFIRANYHHLIPWAAAIILRLEADEQAPSQWLKRRDEIRMRFHKTMSQNQPYLTGPRPLDSFLSDFY